MTIAKTVNVSLVALLVGSAYYLGCRVTLQKAAIRSNETGVEITPLKAEGVNFENYKKSASLSTVLSVYEKLGTPASPSISGDEYIIVASLKNKGGKHVQIPFIEAYGQTGIQIYDAKGEQISELSTHPSDVNNSLEPLTIPPRQLIVLTFRLPLPLPDDFTREPRRYEPQQFEARLLGKTIKLQIDEKGHVTTRN